MTNDEKIDKIQQELKQLSQKHLELEKAHQNQFFVHRWLQGPDPELESVISEIARLEKDKDNYFKILQAAASIPPPVPEKDWSKSPFYSHTLRSWNFDYPVDQMGFYVTAGTGIGIVTKALWRSWNIKKASELLKQGDEESGLLSVHRRLSGLSDLELKDQVIMRQFLKMKALAVAGMIIGGFTAFVQLKNKNRFNK